MPGTSHSHPACAEPRGRAVECALLFFVLPLALPFFRHLLAFRTVPLGWLCAAAAALFLSRSEGFDQRRLWHMQGSGAQMRAVLWVFLPGAALVTGFTAWALPDLFLSFLHRRPLLWTAVLLLYPVAVAYPQELVFRAFFFHRYGALFPRAAVRVAASGVSFGLYHLFYGNAVAPLLATAGGVLFAYRYWRSGSVLPAAWEHALWGDLLFATGLGWYFYSGSIK